MEAIIAMESKKYLQDRGLLFWMIILPILFTVIFISVFTSGVSDDVKTEVITSIIPGYAVMFVFFVMINMAETLLNDKNSGMIARIASTPLSPYKYLLGKWFPNLFVVLIQIVILFAFGKLVYDISFGQPFALLLISIVLAVTVTGLGLALALLVNSNNMAVALTQVIALGGAVLGGLWMPIDMMPSFIQNFANFLPQFWAHQAYQSALVGELEMIELAKSISILLAFGLAGFFLALIRYPHFLKKARG